MPSGDDGNDEDTSMPSGDETEDEDTEIFDAQARADIAALTKRMDTLETSLGVDIAALTKRMDTLETSLVDTLQQNLKRVRKNVDKGTAQRNKKVTDFISKTNKTIEAKIKTAQEASQQVDTVTEIAKVNARLDSVEPRLKEIKEVVDKVNRRSEVLKATNTKCWNRNQSKIDLTVIRLQKWEDEIGAREEQVSQREENIRDDLARLNTRLKNIEATVGVASGMAAKGNKSYKI